MTIFSLTVVEINDCFIGLADCCVCSPGFRLVYVFEAKDLALSKDADLNRLPEILELGMALFL